MNVAVRLPIVAGRLFSMQLFSLCASREKFAKGIAFLCTLVYTHYRSPGEQNDQEHEGKRIMAKMRVLLAYSGGLDTSIIVPWLKENYDCDVICVAGDVGQGEELEPLHEKAKKCGAEKLYIEDLRKEFVEDFIWPTLKAGAVYEQKYLLGTSFARPLIAKRLVEIAHKENCTAICHGCTGKGNDQVRFELTIKAFDPQMKIIAPWRIWDIKTREQEIEYAEARNIPVPVKKDRPYSMDRNIWHVSHEGADLEDPWNEPPADLLLTMVTPEKAPDKPEYVTIDFEKGVPVAINGEKMDAVALLTKAMKLLPGTASVAPTWWKTVWWV